jgi:hypothetical protein
MKISNDWRVGALETWSPVFNKWIRQHHMVTIRPGENPSVVAAREAEHYRCGTAIPRTRIVIWDR